MKNDGPKVRPFIIGVADFSLRVNRNLKVAATVCV